MTHRRENPHAERGRIPMLLVRFALMLMLATGLRAQADRGPVPPPAQSEDLLGSEVLDLPDLADLMEVEITSASGRSQSLLNTAAAAFVISNEDIRRLQYQSLPDLLRIVPGMNVAQISRSRWSVSSRGLPGEFANNLLVMMDGRAVYTPLFAGTFWDVQDTVLEDLDRIEVIRGPGATLWGANAVHGVISVVSKRAEDTQGWFVKGGYGTEDNGFGQARYGGRISEDAAFRVYLKWFDRDGFATSTGSDAPGDWDSLRGGFRLDWTLSESDRLTIQGDGYGGNAEAQTRSATFTAPYVADFADTTDYTGFSFLARWTHEFAADSELSLQMYYDRTDRDNSLIQETRDTFDLDVRQNVVVDEIHELTFGVGYRVSIDDTDARIFSFTPESRSIQLFSAFVQDALHVAGDDVVVTIGSKFEYNDFSGFEIQPSIRARAKLGEDHAIWGAISRAVRTPARADHGLVAPANFIPGSGATPPTVAAFVGSPRVSSSDLIAFELGYRGRPLEDVSLDVALYYNIYDDLRYSRPGSPSLLVGTPAPVAFLPVTLTDEQSGYGYGAEVAATWQVTDDWRLSASYTFTSVHLDLPTTFPSTGEGWTPSHQFNVRSYWDVSDDLSFDTVLYYVDNLSDLAVPSYLRWDAQVTWRPTDFMSVAVGVHNILDDRHKEFRPELARPASESERYGFIAIQFTF